MDEQNANKGLIGHIIGWFSHPFTTRGNALDWVLFVGLLIVAVWFWNHILLSIQQEV